MIKEIKAIAFDIDGTLYSDMSLYIRILPYFLKRLPFFLAYNRARKILHRTAPLADFYEYQARLLAEELKIDSPTAKKMIQENVYDGMKPFFKKIKTFKGVHKLFEECKKQNLKIGILSDFPPLIPFIVLVADLSIPAITQIRNTSIIINVQN